MQFKFDANQEFQLQAIEAVAGLLEGQPRVDAIHELRLHELRLHELRLHELRLHEAGYSSCS